MTNKQKRQFIYDKYGGRCAYCGCDLNGKFHVDEIEPCQRRQVYVVDQNNLIIRNLSNGKPKTKVFIQRPERINLLNQNPSCASCNINKHDMSIEEYRNFISRFMKHLNERSTQYKFAKKYGLIVETNNPVVFYFETLTIEMP